MSYILEALRKSEKERKQDEIPVLQTIHSPRRVASTGKTIFFSMRWILILMLLVSIMGIMFWMDKLLIIDPQLRQADLSERQVSAPSLENSGINNSMSEPHTTERSQQKKAHSSSQTGSKLPSETTIEQDPDISRTVIREPAPLRLTKVKDDQILVINRQSSDIQALTDLPPSVQADIQRLKFAGHVYSEDPTRRMIMINNKILHEGDSIDANFRLQEITRNGVILLHNSTHFRVDLF
jgi:general secretion pathway protein B